MGRQLTIKIKPGQDVNRAILKLKSLAINEGIFKEAKDRKYFVPAGIKRKRKREEAEKQRAKDIRKELRAIARADMAWEHHGKRSKST
jgi:ribosomal protein S21